MSKPKPSPKPPNTRALAAQALAPVLQQKASLDNSIEHVAQANPLLTNQDLAFVKAQCFGVCRHYFSLEAALSALLSKSIKSKDSDIKALLLVGIYQLWHMRVPNHAAINECVNATKVLKKLWAKNLANAVLRNFIRQQDTLTASIEKSDAQFEHPPWLLGKLKKQWPDKFEAIVGAANTQAPLTLRVNQLLLTRDAYIEELSAQDIECDACAYSPVGIRLKEAEDVTALPGFAEGKFSVQDEAAQLSAPLLQLEKGMNVLDACCAPGGKTCHIAESQNQLATLVALDADAHRMQRVEENLQRLNLFADIKISDAGDTAVWWNGKKFDRILLDAPCSATGVIRHHPDIKLLRRPEDIPSLVKLQGLLLRKLWPTLQENGQFLYATCSILPEENEKVIQGFVEEQADAIHLNLDVSWGEARPYGRQLFPHINGHDGFYYSLLKKATNT
ncbi:MAG: 16S rRNA (cytosine(967)-C(5))-methyltransferase RsmB [Agarilytica sp.]